jgi:hypothetical protein
MLLSKQENNRLHFLVLKIVKTDDVHSRLITLELGKNLVRTENYSIFNLPKEMKVMANETV